MFESNCVCITTNSFAQTFVLRNQPFFSCFASNCVVCFDYAEKLIVETTSYDCNCVVCQFGMILLSIQLVCQYVGNILTINKHIVNTIVPGPRSSRFEENKLQYIDNQYAILFFQVSCLVRANLKGLEVTQNFQIS